GGPEQGRGEDSLPHTFARNPGLQPCDSVSEQQAGRDTEQVWRVPEKHLLELSRSQTEIGHPAGSKQVGRVPDHAHVPSGKGAQQHGKMIDRAACSARLYLTLSVGLVAQGFGKAILSTLDALGPT